MYDMLRELQLGVVCSKDMLQYWGSSELKVYVHRLIKLQTK